MVLDDDMVGVWFAWVQSLPDFAVRKRLAIDWGFQREEYNIDQGGNCHLIYFFRHRFG